MLRHAPHVVVGLCGRSGSGKTTIARLLREHFRLPSKTYPVCLWKFAGPLREGLRYWGVEKGDQPGEDAHPDFRRLAQVIGHLMRSEVGPDFWVDLQRHAIASQSAPSVVIYDDVRYANEAEMCDLTVKLTTTRPNALTAEQLLHPTETSWEYLRCDLTEDTDDPDNFPRIADHLYSRVKALMESK